MAQTPAPTGQGAALELLRPRSTGPLAGLVVADFSRILAGPYCTMLLADLGATVIKVESPQGDDTRSWSPPTRGDEATYYLAINRNKSSIALNLKDPQEAALAQRIAAQADVFIENFRTGALARFGLDYDSVAAANPRVIYSSISGFGTKQGANLPGYDLLVQALSGLMSMTGDPDGTPFRAGISVFDVMTGMHSAVGILAALQHRERTGQGQHVETNLMSSALSGLVNQTSAYVAGGVVPQRMGNAHLSLFPYEPLRTADGDLIVVAGNNRQFAKLCEVLDLPDLPTDPRFAEPADRNERRELLRPLLLERLARHTAADWFDILTAADVPCAPIQDVAAGVRLAERLGLEPVVDAGSGADAIPTIRNPITFSVTPPTYDLRPPRLNGNRTAVLEWLSTTEQTSTEEERSA
ncbi:CaiB/BaiF CoA transferase family protein [Glutamicibacter protophormiae]|uniref:CaiB/BaiF CoA transferase family protein n=1 Tax=Glutamicibacter protophormiae TaxID=37930 RepID=UPI003A8E6835